MKPQIVKKLLFSEIAAVSDNFRDYCFYPDRDFSRNRKLPFKTIVKNIIGMESKSLTNELIDQFEGLVTYPSSSAFVQQRQKIKPLAFKDIFIRFTNKFMQVQSTEMRVLAVDGSDIQISTNPNDLITYHPGTNGQKPYNLLHLNALYDIENHLYVDAEIQGKMEDFRKAQEAIEKKEEKPITQKAFKVV